MVKQKKGIFLTILFILISLLGVILAWDWVENKGSYIELTEEQKNFFKWQNGDDFDKLISRYQENFTNAEFIFPRQKVTQVKLYRNINIFSIFTSRKLKSDKIDSFLMFCNDPANFDWGETTWDVSESEYYVNLYGTNNEVVGKIYFCLEDCGMSSAQPFCPAMKFGALSTTGKNKIKKFIRENNYWE